MATKIIGPEATKSTVDFAVGHGFSLRRELIRPKTKTSSAHRASLGVLFSLNQVGIRTRTTMATGRMQANKMEACLTIGGQLWMAVTEKITIKRVEKRNALKAQSSQRARIALEMNDSGIVVIGLKWVCLYRFRWRIVEAADANFQN